MKRMVPIYIYNQLEQAKELIKDMSSPNKGEKGKKHVSFTLWWVWEDGQLYLQLI